MTEPTNGQTDGRRPRFDFTIGPAFFAIVLQTVLALIGGAYIAGQVSNTADNTKATTERLTRIIDRQSQRADGINDRLIKVETLLDDVGKAVAVISSKIDRVRSLPP